MMGHSMQRAGSYQVTRLGELGELEPWTGKSVKGQSPVCQPSVRQIELLIH